jgi:hypothetical protein
MVYNLQLDHFLSNNLVDPPGEGGGGGGVPKMFN